MFKNVEKGFEQHKNGNKMFVVKIKMFIFAFVNKPVNQPKHYMKLRILKTVILAILPAGMMAQAEFRNPVIPGYHPDPSICRVGDTFYLVNSSFQYFPGVPLSESKDLVHWRHTANVLTDDAQLPLTGASSWLGIYAPTIRYNDGTWYMITTNVGNGGNFMVTATAPRGPWSKPLWLKQQGIDPSLFFENGKCYMCSNPGDAIWLCEIDARTGRQLTESRMLWRGDGGRYPDGPHIYKKDGYYYLLISEGGTELAHSITVARSKNIYGPYESNPDNPILTNCNRLGQSKQIQGTGHGDLVEDAQGKWWIVFLAYRNFGGSYHHLGRETCLAPVEWNDKGWPVVNGGQPIDTVMHAAALPQADTAGFNEQLPDGKINKNEPYWMYIQNPLTDNYFFSNGSLVMKAHGTLTGNDRPSFLGVRQTSPQMTAETELLLRKGCGADARAGLTVYQINDGHIDICVSGSEQHRKVTVQARLKSMESQNSVYVSGSRIRLRVSSDGLTYRFECSDDGGKTWKKIAEHNCMLVSTEVAGGFTGVTIGMFCEGDNASADFSMFRYRNME